MTHKAKKFFNVAIAAAMLTTASLATAPTASAGQWQQNHGGHGGGMNTGVAIGFGMAMVAAAIAASAKNQRHGIANTRRSRTVKKRCRQAKEWARLAKVSRRNFYRARTQQQRDIELRNLRYRKRKAAQARLDCQRWARR